MPDTSENYSLIERAFEAFKSHRIGEWVSTGTSESIPGEAVNAIVREKKIGFKCVVFKSTPMSYASGSNDAVGFEDGLLKTGSYGSIKPFESDGEFIYATLNDLTTGQTAHFFIGDEDSCIGFIDSLPLPL